MVRELYAAGLSFLEVLSGRIDRSRALLGFGHIFSFKQAEKDKAGMECGTGRCIKCWKYDVVRGP